MVTRLLGLAYTMGAKALNNTMLAIPFNSLLGGSFGVDWFGLGSGVGLDA